ncbi:hypothetical protein MBLNU230_g2312t1 [Neophaeotheca triangularis]
MDRIAKPFSQLNLANLTHQHRSITSVTRALQIHFTTPKLPQSLPNDARRQLQNFVEQHDGNLTGEEADQAAHELSSFYDKYVGDIPQKIGIFAGVLKELSFAVEGKDNIVAWWEFVVKPIVSNVGYSKTALKDAQDFIVGVMVQEEDGEAEPGHTVLVASLCKELLNIYVMRTKDVTENDDYSARDNQQIAVQVENILCAFGQKQPNNLFHGLSDLIKAGATRMQGLTLLTSFLRHQSPRLYLAAQTPIVEQVVKCLMNDTVTPILSVALTSLVMLLPHVPSSLGPYLPQLFIIYSRLLCWERFNPPNTYQQRKVVFDDRLVHSASDSGEVGLDAKWERMEAAENAVQPPRPEVGTYYTYLYGLYPLHFMSYIRKSRKFLKNIDFPGADDFDLNQVVIRSRSEVFRQEHLLHPNFYSVTIEEELTDPKWTKMEAAEVAAECHSLCLHGKPALAPPGPPPTGKLPDPPTINSSGSRGVSPTQSHASLRSGNSWRNTQSTAVQSPTGVDVDSLKKLGNESGEGFGTEGGRPSANQFAAPSKDGPSLDDFPRPDSSKMLGDAMNDEPITNLEYLQREIALLRSQLNFEQWQKAQYSQRIGQIARKNTKDCTADAENLNLIHSNRRLQMRLKNLMDSRSKTSRDAGLTRNNSTHLEAHLSERYNKLRKEQEIFLSEKDELRRLREESKEYRELLVQSEARELENSHNLEIMQRHVDQMHKMHGMIEEAEHRIRDYEDREFEFAQAKREADILSSEKKTDELRIDNLERTRVAHLDKISDLEARYEALEPFGQSGHQQNVQAAVQTAVAESQTKLAQMKKAHTRLLEKYTDLELEYQSLKAQLDTPRQIDYNPGNESYVFKPTDSTTSPNQRITSDDFQVRDLRSPDIVPRTHNTLPETSDYHYQPANISTSDPTSTHRFQEYQSQSANPPRFPTHPALGSTGLPIQGRIGNHSAPPQQSHSHPQTPHHHMPGRNPSMVSSASSGIRSTFNRTAPLPEDGQQQHASSHNNAKPAPSEAGSDGSNNKKKSDKITPKSEVRVFGRGGAQNVKLKNKDGNKNGGGGGGSSSSMADSAGGNDKEKEKEKKGFRRFIFPLSLTCYAKIFPTNPNYLSNVPRSKINLRTASRVGGNAPAAASTEQDGVAETDAPYRRAGSSIYSSAADNDTDTDTDDDDGATSDGPGPGPGPGSLSRRRRRRRVPGILLPRGSYGIDSRDTTSADFAHEAETPSGSGSLPRGLVTHPGEVPHPGRRVVFAERIGKIGWE